MKKTLLFLLVALPLGAVLSIVLSIILAGVTFCRSFADYWAYIIVQFFPIYGQQEEEEPKKLLGEETRSDVWERHIARIKAKEAQEKDNTKSN